MITDEQMEVARHSLVETDHQEAKLHYRMESAEIARKRKRAEIYTLSLGSQELRKAQAETHESTQASDDEWLKTRAAWRDLKNKRDSWERDISIWQSMNKRLTK